MVGKILIKLLGLVDIIAALTIMFGWNLPFVFKSALLAVLLVTGVLSFFYRDALSIIDGATDFAAVFLIATGFPVPTAVKLVVVFIMLEKGVVSVL